MRRSSHIAVLMTVLAALLWATSFSVIKVGLRSIEPYTFLFLRFVIATALLVPGVLAARKGRLLLKYIAGRYPALLGLALAASFGFQFRAQTEIPASTAAIIINSSTLLVAPLSAALLTERIGIRKVIALVLGMAGVYLITARSAGGGAGGTLLGNLLISASAVSTAIYIVVTKKALSEKRLEEFPLITAVFIWTLPVYLVLAAPALRRGVDITGEAWVAIIYLAVFCTALAFMLWARAIRRIGALTSAIVLLSELVFGVLIARIFLAEALPVPTLAGCALIGLGIFVVGVREQDERASVAA
ncbi:MAG: DMT family transporter [bacterium]